MVYTYSPSPVKDMIPLACSSGIKPPPKSAFLSSECASRDELVKLCFSPDSAPSGASRRPSLSSTISSVEECDSGTETQLTLTTETVLSKNAPLNTFNATATTYEQYGDGSSSASTRSLCSTNSRQGRDNQRWEMCPKTGCFVRLTTGSVPITKDGSIIFVSSAKKREWILPKGGWELDETLEEGAKRETFEEAGLVGSLGPALSEVLFETRKGRKMRLASLRQKLSNGDGDESVVGVTTGCTSCSCSHCNLYASQSNCGSSIASAASSEEDDWPVLARHSPPRLGPTTYPVRTSDSNEEKLPARKDATEPKSSVCRLAVFPLYVSEVHENWPESGRTRKAFPIDEAIKMVTRQEIRLVLEEVKLRGLHLVKSSPE
eukprot:CAMPEP_0195541964 /NCGR_PEP_ID=MMETSP0794_2-20130614/51362_1 /TAXON_ID=515487 /ORGANISM="Stephanopyxis turris, Strain CCMP 815" /LENGTH=375 /DNA_ID=CAMNT_0040676085 /DNA_START=775 /DNA_END=1902 /DNA_ORIENTATION=-